MLHRHAIADLCWARREGIVYLSPYVDPSEAHADSICLRERINPEVAEGDTA